MALSYAGVGLNLLTEEYAEWLAQYHTVTDFPLDSVWGYSGFDLERLPLPHVPLSPASLEVGTLYWPNGLVRCGLFCAVVSGNRLERIRTALGSNSAGPADLVVSDSSSRSVTHSLYLIAVRPLSVVGSANGGYLLVLADQRWYLRQRVGSVTEFETWEDLLLALASQLGITLTVGEVNSAYCNPDPERWSVLEKPLAPVLEAACYAIGHKLVANRDGTFSTTPFADAKAAADAEKSEWTRHTAGHYFVQSDLVRSVPASVKVVFQNGSDPEAAPYTTTKTLASLSLTEFLGSAGVTGQQATIYAEVAYQGDPAGVADYATQAAKDWYLWHLTDADITFPAVAEWLPTGWEDRIEWKYTENKVLTRVVRPPFQLLPFGTFGGAALCGTTTTTAGPCTGKCKWNWNDTTKQWVLDTTTCSSGCKCFAPDWCPNPTQNNSSLCTETLCGRFSSDQVPPNCTGTTTTTTGAGGTTTTTTGSVGCTGGCTWYCHPKRGWQIQTNNCRTTCPCSPPPASACSGANLCSIQSTPCVSPPPPPPPVCVGGCRWVWVVPDNDDPSYWDLFRNSCNIEGNNSGGQITNCYCDPPPLNGTECGQETDTPCYQHGSGPPNNGGTTTTAGPFTGCQTPCRWRTLTGTSWDEVVQNCPPSCLCQQPLSTPSAPCQTQQSVCVPPIITTTTTPSLSPCQGGCQWLCYPDGNWRVLTSTCFANQPVPCNCLFPAYRIPQPQGLPDTVLPIPCARPDGLPAGQVYNTSCGQESLTTSGPYTTTTTTATPTTTTSQCRSCSIACSCPGCAPNDLGTWVLVKPCVGGCTCPVFSFTQPCFGFMNGLIASQPCVGVTTAAPGTTPGIG